MDRRRFLAACAGCAGCAAMGALGGTLAFAERPGLLGAFDSPYFTAGPGGAVQCAICPRRCLIARGERGWCRVRENQGGKLVSLAYGNPCAVNIDPVEKKPFFHVLPGTRSFSVATAGCNFDCKFCQNFEISQARPEETFNQDLPPAAVAEKAAAHGCRSVASTYVEPTVFLEYMIDIGRAARPRGILNTMHSNGYINPGPLNDLCAVLDAACIDLKGFTEAYYQGVTEGTLAPVLDTLRLLKKNAVHTEIVNLMLPGKNDADAEVRAMCRFIRDELSPDTPLHFTRFYPLYKLRSLPPTPLATLERAREIALAEGLSFVYIGNVPGNPAENTTCPQCKAELVKRTGFSSRVVGLEGGKCGKCGRGVPGIWT
jgi:pyruvate formate lyase activating enzyme